jgi:hypothetical protein
MNCEYKRLFYFLILIYILILNTFCYEFKMSLKECLSQFSDLQKENLVKIYFL